MKAAVYRVPGRSHEDHLTAMARGLSTHGLRVEYFEAAPAADADFAVVWSWRVGLRIRPVFSGPILVMERGYLGDRFHWTSLGWDGLNGRARFARVDDSSRFDEHFGGMLAPWRPGGGYALIAGQVVGDTALIGIDILKWYRQIGVELWRQGWDVKFRQHPVEVQRGVAPPHVSFAERLEGDPTAALSGAGLVVTYNSNFATDALMAGVPVHAQDQGSIVYDLASHDLQVVRPDRKARLEELAWRQFSRDEISTGAAWEVVKEAMHA
ncbi:hypothetical protein [Shinella zoogloeoides]|uniref:hypothetical protein n=1 Tax=Shinella zoogloeoides TaxID=352475 RepID=UPI00299D249B|nr:hypothetical protein [Shinella zoogloeoides]WPE19948.1 hypothetical protein ShzoTeo12_11280 [Shinella zoogloeoides]